MPSKKSKSMHRSIECAKNGPYLVRNVETFTNSQGDAVPPGDWEVWQTSLHNPDFAEYARLCGAHCVRVTKAGELDGALATAIVHPGPALVEVLSDPELI